MCIPGSSPCVSCFLRSVGKGCGPPPCPPKVILGWRQERPGTSRGPAAKSFKGNQAFGWQDHCSHICSFRSLCCYSTDCGLGCPLPSAKTMSPRPGPHLALTEPSEGYRAFFLLLERLGQAAGVAFLCRQGRWSWIWEGVQVSETGI